MAHGVCHGRGRKMAPAELESRAGFLMVWRGGLAREGLLVKQKVSESIRRVDIGLFKGCKGRSGE